jgi:hypothetical protein
MTASHVRLKRHRHGENSLCVGELVEYQRVLDVYDVEIKSLRWIFMSAIREIF